MDEIYSFFLYGKKSKKFSALMQDRFRVKTPEREHDYRFEHLTERRTYRKSAVVTLMPSWIQAGFHYWAGEVDVK